MAADQQMSLLWDFTWIWALWDYSLCKDYGSNPPQSQLMVSGSASHLRQMIVIGGSSLQSECLEDPVWMAVWGIPAD